MDLRWRNVSLALALAAAFATPTLGQSGSAESFPDFSGIWAHANPGFEPLSTGPTSLVNQKRRPNGTGDILNLTGDYTNPILKQAAAAAVQKHAQYHAQDKGDPNPRNQCHLEGPPFVFTNGPTRIVQGKDKVAILYQYNHQVRHVRMNAQHPAKVTPSSYGDSVGRYEGDTLVIDTVGIKVGKYSMVDWYGTPHSDALHVVERYRMLSYDEAKEGFERDAKEHNVPDGMPVANANGKYMQLHFTVEDPNVFNMPWSATMTYRNVTGNDLDWVESVCAENTQWFPGQESDVPQAAKPDF
jgi:hypothetical protein